MELSIPPLVATQAKHAEVMAGLGNNPVQFFWTLRGFDWEFFRLETGPELPSSWLVVPDYGLTTNRNSLDFMRWSDFDHGAQDLKES